MTQTIATQHLSPEAIHQLVDYLPDYIKAALLSKSTELECSLSYAIFMAISSFLDEESFSFEDCLLAQRLKDKSAYLKKPNTHSPNFFNKSGI